MQEHFPQREVRKASRTDKIGREHVHAVQSADFARLDEFLVGFGNERVARGIRIREEDGFRFGADDENVGIAAVYANLLTVGENGRNERRERGIRRRICAARCAAQPDVVCGNGRRKQIFHPVNLQPLFELRNDFRDLIDRLAARTERFHEVVALFAAGNRVVFLNEHKAIRRFRMYEVKPARSIRRLGRRRRFAEPARINLPAAFVVLVRERNAGFERFVLKQIVHENFAEYRVYRFHRVKFERGG